MANVWWRRRKPAATSTRNWARSRSCSYYEEWATLQTWVAGTRRAMDLAVYSVSFGGVAFSDFEAFPAHRGVGLKWMSDKPLEASTIKTRFNNVRAVIRAA